MSRGDFVPRMGQYATRDWSRWLEARLAVIANEHPATRYVNMVGAICPQAAGGF